MRRWLFMLGGLLVWAAHFAGVYAIASVADVVAHASAPAARALIGAFTLVCVLAAAGIAVVAARRRTGDAQERFSASLAALGGALAAVAILWQGLPALVGH